MCRVEAPPVGAILAGGLGTRLRTVVSDRPKPLALAANQPFLAHLLRHLEDQELREVVLCTGYMGEMVRQTLGEQFKSLRLRHSHEPEPLGTGGALRYALPLLSSDPVLVLNGDSWCEFNLPAFKAWHRARQAAGSIWLSRVPDTSAFGRVEIDQASGRILEFIEKGASSGPGWVSAGIYLLSSALLQSIPVGRPVSLEREIFPQWSACGLYGFVSPEVFFEIGTPESLARASEFFATHRATPAKGASRCRYVLLDRDGTICVDRHYLDDPNALELLPGAADGLKLMQENGCALLVLTNQSAVGRGYFDLARLDQIHGRLRSMLAEQGISLDGIYYCPHRPEENCACRKPLPGMAAQAAADLRFDPAEAIVIGDNACDIGLGKALGATTILVTTGYGDQVLRNPKVCPEFVASSLVEAAQVIKYLARHNEE